MKTKTIAYILAAICVALLIVSCIMPPAGVIDPSVIQGVAEIIGIITLFFVWDSVDKGMSGKFSHGSTSVEFTPRDED